jgi:hypothetical protein
MKKKGHNLTIFELPFLLLYAVLLAVVAGVSLLGVAFWKSVSLSIKAFKYALKAKFLKTHVLTLSILFI